MQVSTRSFSGWRGFTLIELLVVVAVIALLIGLLVPALGRARGIAQTSVCLSNQRQMAIANSAYASDEDNFIPGPNTSGLIYRINKQFARQRGQDSANSFPMSPMDWMSPTLGPFLDLPRDRNARLLALLNDEFRCPANPWTYDFIFRDNGEFPDASEISYASYGSHFTAGAYWDAAHMASSTRFRDSSGNPIGKFLPNFPPADRAVDIRTSGHKFRTDTLGVLSMKVWTYEGTRFVNSNGERSFNADDDDAFGDTFMGRGPTININFDTNGNPHRYKEGTFSRATGRGELNDTVAQYTFRHGNEAMTMGFFDGHADVFEEQETRFAKFYFPSGSIVRSTNGFADVTLSVGELVP